MPSSFICLTHFKHLPHAEPLVLENMLFREGSCHEGRGGMQAKKESTENLLYLRMELGWRRAELRAE